MKPHCPNCRARRTRDGKSYIESRRIWILVVADRGMIAYAKGFRRRRRAQSALATYLRRYEDYDGPEDLPSIANWLAEHDERLSVEIFAARLSRR